MRVITGTARGRKLETLAGQDVRPTADRVKEAVFSVLQFDIEGRAVLDLFAGSGQLGIEALSRGAALAVFIDAAEESVNLVKRNLQTVGLAENARVVRSDYASFLAHTADRFDIAFLDPPYHKEILEKALPMTARVMSGHGVILCEHPAGAAMPDAAEDFLLARQYRYGKTAVSVYRKREESL